MSRVRNVETVRSRWGGTETRQITSSPAAMKREARGTFRVKDRIRAVEAISTAANVTFESSTTMEDSYSRSYNRSNTYTNDSDSSDGWDKDSLEGGSRRKARLAKSSTTANMAGRKEARSSRGGLETSRSSNAINDSDDRKKGRVKSSDIDRLVDRLSKSKRTSREVTTPLNDNKLTRKSAGRGDDKKTSPPFEYKRSNTFDMDDDDSAPAKAIESHVGRGHRTTPPRELHRSNTFEKDEDSPVTRQRTSGSRTSPGVAWPSNTGEEDSSTFKVVTRKKTDVLSTVDGGTFVRRKKTDRAPISNRWSLHSEDSLTTIGRSKALSGKFSSDDVPSLFRTSRTDVSRSEVMASSPDLSFTPSKDPGPFPSGKLQKDRPQDRSNTSVSSQRSHHNRDSPAKDASDNTSATQGRTALSDILQRASRRKSGKPVTSESPLASDRPIGRPYKSVFEESPENAPETRRSTFIKKNVEDIRDTVSDRDATQTPDSSSGKGESLGRRFRKLFKKRRDSDESDNSGKDTGFSSGRSNSPSRDSITADRDHLIRRDELPEEDAAPEREKSPPVFRRSRTRSPDSDRTRGKEHERSSSPWKSGSSTPKRRSSIEKAVSPPWRGSRTQLSPENRDDSSSVPDATLRDDEAPQKPFSSATFRQNRPRVRTKVDPSAADNDDNFARDPNDDNATETMPLRTSLFTPSDKMRRRPAGLVDGRRRSPPAETAGPASVTRDPENRRAVPTTAVVSGQRELTTPEPEVALSDDIPPEQQHWMRDDSPNHADVDESLDEIRPEPEKPSAVVEPLRRFTPDRDRNARKYSAGPPPAKSVTNDIKSDTVKTYEFELSTVEGDGIEEGHEEYGAESLIPVDQYVSDMEPASDCSLDIEFERMQLNSTQQEDSLSTADKHRSLVKDDLISFSPAVADDPSSLKRQAVGGDSARRERLSAAPPDVAMSPAPAPTPAAASPAASRPTAATAASRAAASPAPSQTTTAQQETHAGEHKNAELAYQEQLLKKDRDIQVLQETVAKLKQQLAASQSSQQRMSKVVELYTSALATLGASRWQLENQLVQERQRLTADRDEAREEVANIETMFADLHRKYEKGKTLLQENKQSGELVASELDQVLAQVSREQQRYDMLQQYAEDTMQRLQQDMVMEQKSQETEALRMSARLQLAENRASKLERENREVTAICDELIQKMSGPR